jgi:HSP20 family protein
MARTKEVREDPQQERSSSTSMQQRDRDRSFDVSTRSASPFSFMRRFSEEMDRLFDDFSFGRGWLGFGSPELGRSVRHRGWEGSWFPQIEMHRRNNQLALRADLPGLKKEDVQVEIDQNNCLTIQGERRKDWKEEDEQGRYLSERSYGKFYRCVQLPEGTTVEDIKATFQDGVLEVTIPVAEAEQTHSRKIEIQG